MHKIILVILILLSFKFSVAQSRLVIENTITNKKIYAIPGSTVSVYYKGYNRQTEFYKNTLLFVSDSSIILGLHFMPFYNYDNEKPALHKEILFKDMIAIKKISFGRNIIKTALNLATVYGSFYLFQNHINRENYSTMQNFGITLGVGLGSAALIRTLFNEKPKHKIKDSWRIYKETDF